MSWCRLWLVVWSCVLYSTLFDSTVFHGALGAPELGDVAASSTCPDSVTFFEISRFRFSISFMFFFWEPNFFFAFRFSHVAEFGYVLKIGTAFSVSYRLSELHWYFDSYAHDAFAVLVVHCIEYTNMFSMFFHACKPDYIILLMWSLKFYNISKQEQCLNNTLLIRSALRCAMCPVECSYCRSFGLDCWQSQGWT